MRLEHVFLHVLAHAANCSTANSEVLVKISLSGTLPPLAGEPPQPRSSVNSLGRLSAVGATPRTSSVGGLVGTLNGLSRLAPLNLIHVHTGTITIVRYTPSTHPRNKHTLSHTSLLTHTHGSSIQKVYLPITYLSSTLSLILLTPPTAYSINSSSNTYPRLSYHITYGSHMQTAHLPFICPCRIFGWPMQLPQPLEPFVYPH